MLKEKQIELCYHCGEQAINKVAFDEKAFCCAGCKSVYQLLNTNQLCDYYAISNAPGQQLKTEEAKAEYNILDDAETAKKLLQFKNETESHVSFYIPYMHCSACIYLLENMNKLNPAIISSRVNFQKKEVAIVFYHQQISLKNIANLLDKIGYAPYISLESATDKSKAPKVSRSHIYKIGIAGFCFGNIMMLSFPEYFRLGDFSETSAFRNVFNYLSLGLSLPVLLYCSQEFFVSAYNSIKQRYLNIDLPIALAILITFLRSVYEISFGSGGGYFDSMSGIVFFMLLGRFFQNKTYNSISFERDYKSYFPLGVTILEKGETPGYVERTIPVSDIKIGMRIMVRQNELIPADAILFKGDACVDYSFVTGEAEPIDKVLGEIIYAGGRQKGSIIELEVVKEVSQSYLTSLWNKQLNEQEQIKSTETELVATINKYFSVALLLLAVGAFIFWSFFDINRGINAVTTLLIVACPCALLLGASFTYGNVLLILSKNKFYVKNAKAVENLANADTIVFDKTGTITQSHSAGIEWVGYNLNQVEKQTIATLASQSLHPLSKKISTHLRCNTLLDIEHFRELPGKGTEAKIKGEHVKMGTFSFTGGFTTDNKKSGSRVYVSINKEVKGYFNFKNNYREGITALLGQLQNEGYDIHLLSGDNDHEKVFLSNFFTNKAQLNFNQSPQQKLHYIENLTSQGKKVIMVGDGLNDAGALMKSHSGIAVSDDVNYFTPACSAIIEGNKLTQLKNYLDFCKSGKWIIKVTFAISLIYNIVGLSYALTGTLQPLIAAILMPLSTISIVLFTTFSSNFIARKKFKFSFL